MQEYDTGGCKILALGTDENKRSKAARLRDEKAAHLAFRCEASNKAANLGLILANAGLYLPDFWHALTRYACLLSVCIARKRGNTSKKARNSATALYQAHVVRAGPRSDKRGRTQLRSDPVPRVGLGLGICHSDQCLLRPAQYFVTVSAGDFDKALALA